MSITESEAKKCEALKCAVKCEAYVKPMLKKASH